MPKPFYMLCSQSGSVDHDSGLISHFNVVDKIQLNLPAKSTKSGFVNMLPMMICATWTREDRDKPTDSFEFEMAFQIPGLEETVMHKGEFQFEKEHYRLVVMAQLGLPQAKAPKSGVWNFESRIRKAGSKAWLRQNFYIPAEVQEVSDSTHNQNGKRRKRR